MSMQGTQQRTTVMLSRRHRMMAAGAAGATRPSLAALQAPIERPNGTPENTAVYESSGQVNGTNGYSPLGVTSPADCESALKDSLAPADKAPESFWQVQINALQNIFFYRINFMLIFVPIGVFCNYRQMASIWVFSTNFLAIIPLASVLGSATEAISAHSGQLLGGLLNATFGNAVEMIMCIQAVKAGLIEVVQGNLLGSILSNLLLVLGMAICASGLLRKTQIFNAQGAAANMTCQAVASISVCLPTMFRGVVGATQAEVLMISRVCSIFLMSLYGLFLFFQLKTHADLFTDGCEEEEEEGLLAPAPSVVLLFLCTMTVALCSSALVGSIEDVSINYGLPKAFIGVILLPIVGNAAEHATAVSCAYKGMMDLALGVAVGSSTQIALFVVPCAVMCGWIWDKPMNLAFRDFDTACQMLSVFLVSQVLQHGNTNWLHGAMLMTTYMLIAVITWFIPDTPGS